MKRNKKRNKINANFLYEILILTKKDPTQKITSWNRFKWSKLMINITTLFQMSYLS